jgi:hypothetical protein
MSLPIKKAVFNLVSTVLIMGGYAFYVFSIHGEKNLARIEELQFWGRFMLIMIGVTIIAKIVLMILFSIVHSIRHGENENIDFLDERDKLIEMKSDRNGNYLFILGIVGAMVPIAMGYPVQYMFIILISSGFLSGILGDLLKIYYYRQGV